MMDSPINSAADRSWAPPPINFLPFLGMTGTWLAVAYVAGRTIAGWPLILVVAFTLLFAVPVALSGAYTSAVSQAMHLAHFSRGGWVYKVCSGRLLRSLFWIVYALVSSFLMLLQFFVFSGLEWIALLLAIPVYWVVHLRSHRIASAELKMRYVFTAKLITAVRWLHPPIMLAVFGAIVWFFAQHTDYATLSEALAAKRSSVPEHAGSAVVGVGLRVMTFVEGGKAYFWQSNEMLSLLVATASAFAVFFNTCATFSCFVIPSAEFKRIVGPVSDLEVPAPLSVSRIAGASALVTIFVFFVFVPLLAAMEDGVRRNPDLVARIEKIAKVSVEMVDGKACSLGTIEDIEAAKRESFRTIALSRTVLEGQVDRAFDKMESNVDSYLDWYYSLQAEYTRLAKLLTGDSAKYMEEIFLRN